MKNIFNKKFWLNTHLYLSLFFLPAAFIYAITGGLYIFGIKENSGAKITEIKLETQLPKGKESESIIEILQDNNLRIPDNTNIKAGRGGSLNMGDKSYSVAVVKDNSGQSILRITDRGVYGILVLMHKAKDTPFFDVIAVGFFISMIIFYLSGLVMTNFCKGKQKAAFSSLAAGVIITALAVFFSI